MILLIAASLSVSACELEDLGYCNFSQSFCRFTHDAGFNNKDDTSNPLGVLLNQPINNKPTNRGCKSPKEGEPEFEVQIEPCYHSKKDKFDFIDDTIARCPDIPHEYYTDNLNTVLGSNGEKNNDIGFVSGIPTEFNIITVGKAYMYDTENTKQTGKSAVNKATPLKNYKFRALPLSKDGYTTFLRQVGSHVFTNFNDTDSIKACEADDLKCTEAQLAAKQDPHKKIARDTSTLPPWWGRTERKREQLQRGDFCDCPYADEMTEGKLEWLEKLVGADKLKELFRQHGEPNGCKKGSSPTDAACCKSWQDKYYQMCDKFVGNSDRNVPWAELTCPLELTFGDTRTPSMSLKQQHNNLFVSASTFVSDVPGTLKEFGYGCYMCTTPRKATLFETLKSLPHPLHVCEHIEAQDDCQHEVRPLTLLIF